MTKPAPNVDSPLSTASFSGTLILLASKLIETYVNVNYQAIANVIASTAITYSSIIATKKIQKFIRKRSVNKITNEMITVIDESVKQLDDIIANSDGDTKEHAEEQRSELLRKKIDLVSGKINVLALDAYIPPTPVPSVEPTLAK